MQCIITVPLLILSQFLHGNLSIRFLTGNQLTGRVPDWIFHSDSEIRVYVSYGIIVASIFTNCKDISDIFFIILNSGINF